jgi:hypothetical protein
LRTQERRAEVYREKLFTTSAEDAARKILQGVAARKGRILIGQAKGVDRLVRLFPGAYPRILVHWERRTFGPSAPENPR